MSQSDVDEDDPEVQRNGFELYAEEFGIPDKVLKEFFDKEFTPSDPWDDNHTRWWHFFTRRIPRCPKCGQKVEDVEEVRGNLQSPELLLAPCRHVVSEVPVED